MPCGRPNAGLLSRLGRSGLLRRLKPRHSTSPMEASGTRATGDALRHDHHNPNRNVYERSQGTRARAADQAATQEHAYSTSEVARKYERLSSKQILFKHGFTLPEGCKLGYGRYSKVCKAVHARTSHKIAVKIIDTRKVTQEYRSKFLPREVHNWRRLRHQNIVALLHAFEEGSRVFLVMELAHHGDLLTYVQKNGAQPEPVAHHWMWQLASATQYMHVRWIAHRDLKLENILLFDNDTVKIADFGFCRRIGTEGDLSLTFCGSKAYSAPEILLGRAYPPFKADVWSLGVIAFVVVTNHMPFDERVSSNTQMVNAQRERFYHFPGRLTISESCKRAINGMMTFDYDTRPTINETLRLPWFKSSPPAGIPAGVKHHKDAHHSCR